MKNERLKEILVMVKKDLQIRRKNYGGSDFLCNIVLRLNTRDEISWSEEDYVINFIMNNTKTTKIAVVHQESIEDNPARWESDDYKNRLAWLNRQIKKL